MSDTDKYVTFNREVFNRILSDNQVHAASDFVMDELHDNEIHDAVVIRRQDKFASPCLLTYAAMISMVAQEHPDINTARELMSIADYFHTQGVLAGEEGHKLPTL